MKKIKYIFFFLILFLIYNNVYANNYIILNNQDINEVKEFLETNDDIIINIDYNNKEELIAKRKVLDLIKDNKKTITYNIINNNKMLYSFKFNGNFNKSYNDINLLINFNTNNKIINDTFNNKIVFTTEYKGYYPNNTLLIINNSINIKNTYIYNIKDNKINKLKNKITKKNNLININIFKGDTYIISNKNILKKETIKTYISLLIILGIELLIFILVILKQEKIELPKLKNKLEN